jgi:hypothetical protein
MNQQRPQRRITDHIHQEYWRESEQHRYEQEMNERLKGIEAAVRTLTQRLTYLAGAIGVLVFLIPVLAPFIRDFLSLQ